MNKGQHALVIGGSLAGTAGLYPPTDEAGFLEFASQLSDPILYNAIRQAEPASAIYGYRRTENQWRHYERSKNWPARIHTPVVLLLKLHTCSNPQRLSYARGFSSRRCYM